MLLRLCRLASTTQKYSGHEIGLICNMIRYKRFKINDEVDVAEKVKVLDKNNNFLGMFNVSTALAKAQAASLDLVLISPNSSPNICKITRYLQEIEQKFFEEVVARHLREEKMGKRFTRGYVLTNSMAETLIKTHHKEILQLMDRNCRVEISVKNESDRKPLDYFLSLMPQPDKLIADNKTKLIYQKPIDLGKLDHRAQIRRYLKKVENKESESINMEVFDAYDSLVSVKDQTSKLFQAVKVKDQLPYIKGLVHNMCQSEKNELRTMLNRMYENEDGLLNYEHYLSQKQMRQERLIKRIKGILKAQ